MTKHIIYNAQIVNENKRYLGFVVIDGDIISLVGRGYPAQSIIDTCAKATDVAGALLIPGCIDDQVHFRDPGLTHKADISTESAAAVAGGVTSFMDMPNTMPQTTSIETLNAKNAHAANVSVANYSFYIGATNDNIEILNSIDYTHTCGVKIFLGASTGNMLVDNHKTLERIFSEVPSLIAIHSEDEDIIRANKAKYTQRHGENLPIEFHSMIRSEEACYTSTARAIELANRCGTQLHVLHLSTAKELSLFSNAPLAEKKITGEVCVHHLWFNDNDYSLYGNRIKWNPAIKTFGDRDALRRALNDGKLDVVATDHAPHLLSEKVGNCLKAASGGPLIQFSLLAMLEMADKGIFTIEQIITKMCHAPATLYHIDRRGFIREGYFADLVVVRQNEPHTVNVNEILSKCGWSPFEGQLFNNKVQQSYVNGNLVYNDGVVISSIKGRRLKFNR
ncbi:MAG: dihydroorotase [Muribaculaceae bacterium]